MKSDRNKQDINSENARDEVSSGSFSLITWIQGVGGSIGRTTVRFVKNIPSRVQNKYMRYRNEKKRLPRRKTKSKVYVLAGYTTKAYVNRRFAAIKVQQIIRKILLGLILVVFLLIMYKWLDPLGNTNELKQIIGIDKIDDLAQEDPFSDTRASNQIQINLATITPSVTPTVTPTPAAT